MVRKLIFKDADIIDFCIATQDFNEIHNPVIMNKIGKRVVVPGMFVFTYAANIVADFLINKAVTIDVFFSNIINSGEFVSMEAIPEGEEPIAYRLSAVSSRDSFSLKGNYTRMSMQKRTPWDIPSGSEKKLGISPAQVEKFEQLIQATNPDVANLLFSIAYASQALQLSIHHPETEVEQEVDALINQGSTVSPFYQSLKICLAEKNVHMERTGTIDYQVFYEREKRHKLYTAHVVCTQESQPIFMASYTMMAISDSVILRMVRDLPGKTSHKPC